MRLSTSVISVLAAAAAMAPAQPLLAESSADARKAIQAAYDKSNAAAAKKDIAGTLAHHVPDFTTTDEKGKTHTLAEMKGQLTQIFQIAKEVHASTTIQSFSLKGNSATVKIEDHATIMMSNP